MKWKEMNKKAILSLMKGEIKPISDEKSNFGEMFEIEDKIVRVVSQGSQTYLLCSCEHNSVHSKSNPICYHKLAVILFCQKEVFK